MTILYRSEEAYSDVAAHDPYNLDRQLMTGEKLDRCPFSDCDGEVAVNAKSARRAINDDRCPAKAVALQKSSDMNRPPGG
jgi:hypothetical protein